MSWCSCSDHVSWDNWQLRQHQISIPSTVAQNTARHCNPVSKLTASIKVTHCIGPLDMYSTRARLETNLYKIGGISTWSFWQIHQKLVTYPFRIMVTHPYQTNAKVLPSLVMCRQQKKIQPNLYMAKFIWVKLIRLILCQNMSFCFKL